MLVSKAVEEYQFAILGKSPKTQRWYAQKLADFAAWCAAEELELEALRPVHLRKYLAHLETVPTPRGKPKSSYTLHGYMQVIKAFFHYCQRDELIDERAYERIRNNVEMPRVEIKVIEAFSDEQVKRLMIACGREESPWLQVRTRAALAMLFDTGIRASELCGLTMDHLFLTPHDSYIRVLGKGRKEREVGLGPNARQLVQRYITRYRRNPHNYPNVFLGKRYEPMTPDTLDRIFYRLRDWAGITGVRCSTHTARHTFACNYIKGGGDIYSLSRILGHASVTTTTGYLRAVKAKEVRRTHISVLDAMNLRI